MLAQEVNKGTNARAYRSVTVIHCAKRHFDRQTFVGHQLNQFTPRDLLINHLVGQAGDTISFEAKLRHGFPAV